MHDFDVCSSSNINIPNSSKKQPGYPRVASIFLLARRLRLVRVTCNEKKTGKKSFVSTRTSKAAYLQLPAAAAVQDKRRPLRTISAEGRATYSPGHQTVIRNLKSQVGDVCKKLHLAGAKSSSSRQLRGRSRAFLCREMQTVASETQMGRTAGR